MPFYYMNFHPLVQPWAHAYENTPTCTNDGGRSPKGQPGGGDDQHGNTQFSEVVEVVVVLAMAPMAAARFTRAPQKQLLV
jgi:hypothetical protein